MGNPWAKWFKEPEPGPPRSERVFIARFLNSNYEVIKKFKVKGWQVALWENGELWVKHSEGRLPEGACLNFMIANEVNDVIVREDHGG